MNFHRLRQVCLLLVASLALSTAESQPQNTNQIDDKLPEKPEPRQIGQIGAVMPYSWMQPSPAAAAAPVSSSWGSSSPSWFASSGLPQSLLSILRPNVVGGRRSSLSSRLRNLMNALFYRRETASPYLTSGSSISYAFRPPPFGFGTGFPTTGLASALGSQNLYGSASFNRPVVLPSYSAPADTWSNYKQYASNGQTYSGSPSNWNTGSSGSSSPSSSIWQNSNQSGSGSQYSSSYPSYSSGSSNSAYQSSASNVYPNTSYQRSSISTYSKPQTSANTSVSSSVSSSSSSSSSANQKSAGYQSK